MLTKSGAKIQKSATNTTEYAAPITHAAFANFFAFSMCSFAMAYPIIGPAVLCTAKGSSTDIRKMLMSAVFAAACSMLIKHEKIVTSPIGRRSSRRTMKLGTPRFTASHSSRKTPPDGH